MNCLAFERQLDGGAPRHLPAAALEHVRACAPCKRSHARAHSLELALERHFASRSAADAPVVLPGFADRVLARVERGEARGVRWLALPDALPWWVRAAAEPSVLLASTVAALVLWRGDALIASARAWFPLAASAPERLAAMTHGWGLDALGRTLAQALVPAPDAGWAVSTATVVGVMPLFALLAMALWLAGEGLVGMVEATSAR